MGAGRKNLLAMAAFLILVAACPLLLTNDYYLSTMVMALLHAVVVVGLNLLLGFAGQISLGHAAFYGLGAYASAILTATFGWPVGLGVLAGMVAAAAVAWVIGIPALKLRGNYLAMATLGFGIIVYIAFNETISLTGGPSGFTDIPPLTLFGAEIASDLAWYWISAGALTAVLAVSLNLIDSKVGRALRAIHTSEKAAQTTSIDIARYKLFIFVLSGAMAGLAGALYAHYLSFVAPSSFGFKFSITLIVMVVLGGMASVWGAVAGAVFLTVLPEFLRAFENIETVIYGAILILCMIFLPGGLAGGAARLWRWATVRGRDHA